MKRNRGNQKTDTRNNKVFTELETLGEVEGKRMVQISGGLNGVDLPLLKMASK